MDFVSCSQAGQDTFVYERLVKPTNNLSGTFLDIGCGEPYEISNSIALERLGWRGLLVDMDPVRVALCRQERKNPVIEHDATTLDWAAVCQEHGLGKEIDYLSLDIDDQVGEAPKSIVVLKNLIDAGFTFRAITSEHNRYYLHDAVRDVQRKMLLEQGYGLFAGDVSDHDLEFEDWWVRS